MNKLQMSTDNKISGNIDKLILDSSLKDIIVTDKTVIKEIEFINEFKTTITIEDNASLIIGTVVNIENIQGYIKIISTNHTNLEFHLGINAHGQNELEIINEINGNENTSEIKVRILSEENADTSLKTTGIILENTKENKFLEDIKYLNEYPGTITCYPELFVSSDDTEANHNMTVGMIDEETLFYLESKGMNKELAKTIIRQSFLNSMQRKEG